MARSASLFAYMPACRPVVASLILLTAAFALAAFNLHHVFPGLNWLSIANDHTDLPDVIAFYGALPRISVAVLCGVGLGFSGAMFQQILRNPLAEPSTLGVSAGAYLFQALATILAPGLLLGSRIIIASCGAGISILLVMAIAWRQSFSILSISLAGLTINLAFGALASILVTFHRDGVVSLSYWGSGALRQNDWNAATALAAGLAASAAVLIPISRSLVLFNLHDDALSSLGVSARTLRLITLALATWMAAIVVACVGIIGFVGLVAPWLARLLGARRPQECLCVAAVLGAALLLATDQTLLAFGPRATALPTGLVTAFLGAPILLVMLHGRAGHITTQATEHVGPQLASPAIRLGFAFLIFVMLAISAVFVSGDGHGWHLETMHSLPRVLPWRWPRLLAAAGSGVALGIAGMVLQRLTMNPMASPELLGVSSGAVLGALAAILLVPVSLPGAQTMGATVGALVVIVSNLLIGRKSHFSSNHFLLVGIGLGTALSAIDSAFAILPDPRFQQIQIWMTGSTDLVSPHSAVAVSVAAFAGLVAAFAGHRWLTILQMGADVPVALGLRLEHVRLMLLLLVSGLTGIATLVVGPLSFAGLMAPHLAKALGARRVAEQLVATALVGGILMMTADWIGRGIAFPYEIPTGLVASVGGGLYFLALMRPRPNKLV